MPRATKSSVLRRSDPVKWAEIVKNVLVTTQGNVSQAAGMIGLSARQLWRWIEKNPEVLEGTGHKRNAAFVKKDAPQDT